jgi:outer membrane protein assembly factor BamB
LKYGRSVLRALFAVGVAAGIFLIWDLWYRSRTADRAGKQASAVQVIWTFEPPERGAIVSSPLVTTDRIYVGIIHDAGFLPIGAVYCLDRATGKPCWKFDDEGAMQQMASSPCLTDGRLYIGEGMHQNHRCKLYCLDAVTSHKLWEFAVDSHIESSPCVALGKVFVGAGDEGLVCLDAVRGSECWRFPGPYHVDSSPTVQDGCVFFGSGVSRTHKVTKIFCLDANTGNPRWQQAVPLPVWGAPTVAGSDLLIGLGNGRLLTPPVPPEMPAGALWCVDKATGAERWRYSECDAVFVRPAVDAQHVFFASRDGHGYCLDRHTGRLCWRVELGSPDVASPALCEGRVYCVASGGRVSCLAADSGAECWTFELAAHTGTRPQIFSSPTVLADPASGGRHHWIYVGTELANSVNSAAVLYCLRD